MSLDLYSIQVMTALVVNVSGVVFVVETLMRRDEGAGRVWAVAFIAGMLTTTAYMVWAFDRDAMWAIAVGNAAFVSATGCMWLGARLFNGKSALIPGVVVGAVAVVSFVAVLLDGGAGDWAGVLPMFFGLIVFAALGAVECVRGELGLRRISWGLAFVLGLQSVFYIGRTLFFLLEGPGGPVFSAWFGTSATSFLTVTLTIVALVVTSVVRASRAELRGYGRSASRVSSDRGILSSRMFLDLLTDVAERARWRGDLVGVIAVRIDDLDQISTAFGSEVVRAVTDAWYLGVRRNSPASAFVGEDGAAGLVITIVALSPSDARRQAALIYRGLFEELGAVIGGVIPVVGVGVGLSDTAGYDPVDMLRVARGAAQRAARSVESSVLVGEAQ